MAGDPLWGNVVLGMHMDGANASTTFTDQKGHACTAFGNAQISTAQFAALAGNAASAYFDGSGDYVSIPNSSDFQLGSGDFFIEARVYIANLTANMHIFGAWDGASTLSYAFGVSAGYLFFDFTATGSYVPANALSAPSQLPVNTWKDVAVARYGTSIFLFVDGTIVATKTGVSATLYATSTVFKVGGNTNAQYFNGYIDDLVVTKGVARYSASYTPSVAPFLDYFTTALVIADHVKETSTTTGTGALTLAGAMTGYQTFAAKCSVGDTVYYGIQAVDGAGAPTGEWECGLGTYSGANTLTRTTVTSSSNSGAAVSFSAGTKQVFITMPAAQVAWARERLTANRTYYVRTDGNDNNTGLANTSGGAFLTVQKAVDTVCNTLSLAGYAVTIQVADGTYTGATTLKPLPDNGSVTIQGNSGTPDNVLISTTSANCFSASGARANYTIKDLKVQTTTAGFGLYAADSASLWFSNINFGACAGRHMVVESSGSITATGNYSISGSSPVHLLALMFGKITIINKTVTITGTPAFSVAFAYGEQIGVFYLTGNTYSGSATGTRYTMTQNSVCTSGVTLPGSTAGGVSTGGLYS